MFFRVLIFQLLIFKKIKKPIKNWLHLLLIFIFIMNIERI